MSNPSASPPGTASLRWSGHWIGHEPRTPTGTPADFLTGGGVGAGFSRSMFRTTVDLVTVPAEAPARVTADSRYVLWVNGHEVGRGPARSQPSRQRYDSYDLAPYLVGGVNALADLVTYYGQPMSFWQPTWTSDHPVGRVTQALLEPVVQADVAELPRTFDIALGHVHHLSVDFGRIVAGFVELDLDAPAGGWMRFIEPGSVPSSSTRSTPIPTARHASSAPG